MPSPARAGEPPTLEAVLAWASQAVNHPDGKTYPVDWAKEWYETMRTADPPWTNVRGESVLPNWKNAMTWAWKRHLKLDKENESAKSNRRSGEADRSTHYEEGLGAEIGRKYGI